MFDDAADSFVSCSSSCATDASYASAFSEDLSLHLSDLLCSTFSSFRSFFNVVHINAQSVPAHYSDMLPSFDSDLIHAVLVSESLLKPPLPSTQYSLPGYKLVRNDRVGKGYGGVAIYLRGDISYKVVDQSPGDYCEFAEHLFIEVNFRHAKLLLGVYYSPSCKINYFSSFETKLDLYCPLYDHTIILGDFNTCLLKNDSRSRHLQSLVSSVNLHLLPLNATHRAPHSTPSLLDLIIVSDPNKVAIHGQLPTSFSYHDLIYISYKVRPPKRKAKYLHLRSFRNIDVDRLGADAACIDWSSIYGCDDLNSKVSAFNSILLELYDQHAPIKKVRVKHLPAPWLTNCIKKLMAKRDRVKRRYRKTPSEELLVEYKSLRNRCNRMCRDAKRRHIYNSIQNSNPSQTWQFLKSLGIGKVSNDCTPTFDLNVLNTHFSKTPITLDLSTKSATLNSLSSLPRPTCNSFCFHPVTEEDIRKSIKSISSKAAGEDGLQLQMLLLILNMIVPTVTHIINHSMNKNTFPAAWKKAFVLPLPKVPNPTSVAQYRPISILPFLSKVLESTVHNQLSHFLFSNSLLSSFQSGFRPGHSTVTALVKITDDIRLAMENKKLTVMVLLYLAVHLIQLILTYS